MSVNKIIDQTRCWVDAVVVGHNFCPFAKRELERERVRFVACESESVETCLEAVFDECEYLDTHENTETTLLIFPTAFSDFEDYLAGLEMAEQLLIEQGYEGRYQLASFHPRYCFAGADEDDAANYTNRSPYPMIHLLRESSLEKALASYEQPEDIPARNIDEARKVGLAKMKSRLDGCCGE